MLKKTTILILISFLLFSILVIGCEKKNTTNTKTGENNQQQDTSVVKRQEPTTVVCVYDQLNFRSEPSVKGKIIPNKSVTKGDMIDWTGISQADSYNASEYEYCKVVHTDGTEGWVISDGLVPGAKPAVIIEEISIYSMPSLSKRTNNTYKPLDIVAVYIEQEHDGWLKVSGKSVKIEDYIKPGYITYVEVDLAVAIEIKKIQTMTDKEEKINILDTLLNDPSYRDSTFHYMLAEKRNLLDIEVIEDIENTEEPLGDMPDIEIPDDVQMDGM